MSADYIILAVLAVVAIGAGGALRAQARKRRARLRIRAQAASGGQSAAIGLNDMVALLEPVDGLSGDDKELVLGAGLVGQVVEALGADAVVLQFPDPEGAVHAIASVSRNKLLRLRYGDGSLRAWPECANESQRRTPGAQNGAGAVTARR